VKKKYARPISVYCRLTEPEYRELQRYLRQNKYASVTDWVTKTMKKYLADNREHWKNLQPRRI